MLDYREIIIVVRAVDGWALSHALGIAVVTETTQ